MAIADKLLELNDVKQDIKTAIEGKGADLTGVDFGGYAGKIDLLPLPKEEQTKTVSSPNFSSGNVIVTPDADKVLTQVTVVKDNNLVPENIVKDVNIFGVVGTAETGGGTPQGETWLINESPVIQQGQLTFDISFISNNEVYNQFKLWHVPMVETWYQIIYDSYIVHDNNSWTNQAYRTVTFETSPTGALLTWLQANAVKQTVSAVVELTQAQYDALSVYDDNTYYLIVEE